MKDDLSELLKEEGPHDEVVEENHHHNSKAESGRTSKWVIRKLLGFQIGGKYF